MWKECPSWPGYVAAKDGRVMSRYGKMMKGRVNNRGYVKVAHVVGSKGKRSESVHRMIADAWLGVCPKGKEVNHKDHNKANNDADNLEYVTHRENIVKAREAGRFPDMKGKMSPRYGTHPSEETRVLMSMAKRGDRHWRAVRPNVEAIMALRLAAWTDTEIAKFLDMKRTTVGAVIRGTHWSVRKC